MFFRRSSAEQLPSSPAMRTTATGAGRRLFDMTLTCLPVGCAVAGRVGLGDDCWRAGDHGDVAGTRDDTLDGALGVLVEHVDAVALGAGIERLATHRDGDAGHFVVQGHHVAAL